MLGDRGGPNVSHEQSVRGRDQQWCDQWLASHGWSLHPNPANMQRDGQLSHRDYRHGIHQQLIVAIDDPAALNRTLNPPHAKTYFELFYYLSYDKADR